MIESVAKKIILMAKKHEQGESIMDYELGIATLKG